jgi:hypothetical protein
MSGPETELEDAIAIVIRAADELLSWRECELLKAQLHRLLQARTQASIFEMDRRCELGGRRMHGRPELNPLRIVAEAPAWWAAECRYRRRRNFESLISSNGADKRCGGSLA